MPRQTEASDLQTAIGQALLQEGVLDEGQLERALRVQRLLDEPKQLGDVVVDLGYADRKSVAAAIAKHGSSLRLGEMLIAQGLVTEETLRTALAAQAERGGRLGEVLIEMGALNPRALQQTIAHQAGVPFIEPSVSMIEPAVLRGVSPEYLSRHGFVPFSRHEDGATTVVVPDMDDESLRHVVEELYQGGVRYALGPELAIRRTIEDLQRFRQRDEGPETGAGEDADPVVRLVEHIIGQAIEEMASDIHIEPMAQLVRLRYRIDGVLVYKTDLPRELLPKIISRLKILAEGNIAEHQRHQGGRILFRHGNKEVDLRLSIYVSVHGQSAVLRVLNKELALVSLEGLGMTSTMLERYRDDVLDLPTGVVLITGPTGSGKTTTLYSSIDYCNDVSRKIITAEDPVEFTIEGIVQCGINEKSGRGFDETLREIVRQDPDIIVLGEIRDKKTAQVAIQAALTGHKVYSTFHTEDTIGGLLRLIDMDIETFLISSTVISVLAQRLLRRICNECAAPYTPGTREIQLLGLDVREVRDHEYRKGRGCERCAYTGYRGRVGVYELLVLNEKVKEAILQKRTAHEIREISMETTGLVSMREDGCAKVVRGLTTFEEVLKHTPRTFRMRALRQILTMCQ
jgi:type IV pilus assembly protein PilB